MTTKAPERVLHLTLKKQWFDMIASGEKIEEYREIKPYWHNRLFGKKFDAIHFRNGYSKGSPSMMVELYGVTTGVGIKDWGASEAPVYILQLGAIIRPSTEVAQC